MDKIATQIITINKEYFASFRDLHDTYAYLTTNENRLVTGITLYWR